MVKISGGKNNILGSFIEIVILEFGLRLGGDFYVIRKEMKIVKVESFNLVRKKMSVFVAIFFGGIRAYCKGVSEIIFKMCDKVLDFNGKLIILFEDLREKIIGVINKFVLEVLRILCMVFKDMGDKFKGGDSVFFEEGFILIVVVGIKDFVWLGVKEVVEICLVVGIIVRMVIGDNIYIVKVIVRECGILINGGLVIEGLEFCDKILKEMKDIILNF